MKKCDYCGRENQDTGARCDVCGTELPVAGPPPLPRPPLSRAQKTVRWFKAYVAILCCCYLFVGILAVMIIIAEPAERMLGFLLLPVAIVFLGACLPPLVVQPRPWLWTYDLVIICLGMTSALCLPAAIVLLIFWLKPDTKEYFGESKEREPFT